MTELDFDRLDRLVRAALAGDAAARDILSPDDVETWHSEWKNRQLAEEESRQRHEVELKLRGTSRIIYALNHAEKA